MPPNRLRTLLAAVGRDEPGRSLDDAELLARFADARDEAAFEALVWRHGPMVRAVCRHVLGPRPEADDAFQATFLVLARKAPAVKARGAVGGWLYTVAGRVARKLRRQLARRVPTVEDLTMVPDSTGGSRPPLAESADLRAVLEEEIARLPEKYRLVVQLCYAAGHPTAEAARRLGVPKGTVLTRLAWARRRLQDRLARRGVTAGVGAFAAALGGAAAGLDPQLVRVTVRVALTVVAGPAAGAVISDQTLHLSEGVIRDMALSKLKLTVGALLVAVAAAGVGVGRWAVPASAGGDDPPRETTKAPPAKKPIPALPPPADPPADRDPDGDKYSEAVRKIERLEKELADLRKEAKRTAPVPPPTPSVDLPPAVVVGEASPFRPPPADPVLAAPPPTPAVDPLVGSTVPPQPPARAKTFTVAGPVGNWHRTAGGHQFSLKFGEDRLTATNVVDTERGSVVVTIDADYSVSRDGVVFGYITGIDAGDAAAHLEQYADAPFSFRFRADEGVLTIKDVKVMPPAAARGAARDEAVLFVPGRYTDKPGPQPVVKPPAVRPPGGRSANPFVPQIEELPPSRPPAAPPIQREVPPSKRPPAPTRPPEGASSDGDPLVPDVGRTPADPDPVPGGMSLPVRQPVRNAPQYIPPDAAADPFRRPDGTSRLLGPGQASALPVVEPPAVVAN